MGPRARARRSSRRGALAVAGALGLALALASCGGGDEPEATAGREVRYAHARQLFREACAGCHKFVDAGATGSADLDWLVRDPRTRSHLVRLIMRVGGDTMPAWYDTYDHPDYEALVRYIIATAGSKRSGDGRRATILTPIASTADPPKDPIVYGRALFREICAGCHTLADADAHGKRFDLDYNYESMNQHEKRIRVHRGLLGFPPFMPNFAAVLPGEQIEALETYVVAVAGKAS